MTIDQSIQPFPHIGPIMTCACVNSLDCLFIQPAFLPLQCFLPLGGHIKSYMTQQTRSVIEIHSTEAELSSRLRRLSADFITVVFCCNSVTVVLSLNDIFSAVLTAGGCGSCDLRCESHLHDISINRAQFQRRREKNVLPCLFVIGAFYASKPKKTSCILRYNVVHRLYSVSLLLLSADT